MKGLGQHHEEDEVEGGGANEYGKEDCMYDYENNANVINALKSKNKIK